MCTSKRDSNDDVANECCQQSLKMCRSHLPTQSATDVCCSQSQTCPHTTDVHCSQSQTCPHITDVCCPHISYFVNIYTAQQKLPSVQKVCYFYFYYKSGKCRQIFTIFSPLNSEMNCGWRWNWNYYFLSNLLLHYLVKVSVQLYNLTFISARIICLEQSDITACTVVPAVI